MRGRHSGNLYQGEDLEALLGRPLGEQRARLRLDREVPEATAGDRAAFVAYAAGAVVVQLLVAALVVALPLVGVVWLLARALG